MSDLQATADCVEIAALQGEFTERVCDIRHLDTSPPAGSAPAPDPESASASRAASQRP